MTARRLRAALRALTERMVAGAGYDELAALLDAIAAMPGADELRAQIAGRRLALLEVHGKDEAERARVLAAVAPDLATVPLVERVAWIAGAGRYKAIVAQHLRPLLPEIEAAAARAPDDEKVQHALWRARVYLGGNPARPTSTALAEGEATVPSDAPAPWGPEISAGLDVVRRLIVARRPYEEIQEAQDAILALPGGGLAAGHVASQRLVMVSHYARDDAEAERVLAQVQGELARWHVRHRVDAVSALCHGRPALAVKHLPPLILELENEQLERPDIEGEQILESARRVLESARTR